VTGRLSSRRAPGRRLPGPVSLASGLGRARRRDRRAVTDGDSGSDSGVRPGTARAADGVPDRAGPGPGHGSPGSRAWAGE
jgi:hypothetical protein